MGTLNLPYGTKPEEVQRRFDMHDELVEALQIILEYPEIDRFIGSIIYGRAKQLLQQAKGE